MAGYVDNCSSLYNNCINNNYVQSLHGSTGDAESVKREKNIILQYKHMFLISVVTAAVTLNNKKIHLVRNH